jgi:hypothetical protein
MLIMISLVFIWEFTHGFLLLKVGGRDKKS